MPPLASPLRIHRSGAVLTFQIDGRATMEHAMPLRRLAEEGLAMGATCVHVDLRRTQYMDSTFVGTLLGLQRLTGAAAAFALVCPSPPCQRVLDGLGLSACFPISQTDEPTDDWCEADLAGEDRTCLKYCVVESHQHLVDCGGKTAAPFRAIVDTLRREMDAETK